MKHASAKLLYHSMHKRPMPGCLLLFFLLAALVVGGLMYMVEVVTPKPLKPRGPGNVYYRNDELTRFQVRQRSALPLRLPAHADPAAQLPVPEHPLLPQREIGPVPAPPVSATQAPDSAVLSAELLLALPPATPEPQEEGGQP